MINENDSALKLNSSSEPDEVILNSEKISERLKLILQPLANTTRQKILLRLGLNKATYTELIEFLDVESGSFYWHINKMKHLVKQNNLREYLLTDLGYKAFELLTFDQNISNNLKIPAWYNSLTPGVVKVLQSPLWLILQQYIMIIVLMGYLYSRFELIQIGTVVIQQNVEWQVVILSLLLSLMGISVFLVLIIYLSQKFYSDDDYIYRYPNLSIFRVFLICNFFSTLILANGFIISTSILLTNSNRTTENVLFQFLIALFAISITIVLTTKSLDEELNLGFDSSLLLTLVVYYPVVILSYLISEIY